jgi:hypothetical protein
VSSEQIDVGSNELLHGHRSLAGHSPDHLVPPSEQRSACLIHFDRPAESIDLTQMGRWVGHVTSAPSDFSLSECASAL